jgi:hypothetical protein
MASSTAVPRLFEDREAVRSKIQARIREGESILAIVQTDLTEAEQRTNVWVSYNRTLIEGLIDPAPDEHPRSSYDGVHISREGRPDLMAPLVARINGELSQTCGTWTAIADRPCESAPRDR